MTLRSQVTVIVFLIVLIPLTGLVGTFLWRKSENVPSVPILKSLYVGQWIDTHVEVGANDTLTVKNDAGQKSPYQFVIVDQQQRLVHSTIASLNYSAATGLGSVYAWLKKDDPGKLVFIEPLTLHEKVYGTVLIVLPEEKNDRFLDHLTVFYNGLMLFFVSLIFASVLISLWLRRLTSTVVRLRNHTELMAAGNWQTPMTIESVKPREFHDLAEIIEKLRMALLDESIKRHRFLSALSHDLRTPLTSIVGYLEALRDGLVDDPKQREKYLGIIQTKTEILEERFQSLFRFARMENQPWKLTMEVHDVGTFLASLGSHFEEEARLLRKSFRLVSTVEPNLCLKLDAAMVTRAIENIVYNGFRYTGSSGEVVISTSSSASNLVIKISDNGPGIPEEEFSRIFEPFSRGQTQGEKTGEGLGLYIAKSIIESHGGTLTVSSELGNGTTFTVKLPCNPPRDNTTAALF